MAKRSARPTISRRTFSIGAGSLTLLFGAGMPVGAAEMKTLDERFDYLSKNGNSTCSPKFADSIAKMPVTARLRGSCCSEMERKRYAEQVQGLTKYAAIPEIPPDPYDIAAGVAQKAMSHYDLALSPDQQRAYQYAMDHSEEKGPCCCPCWRWKMYGGLAKFLITERGFTGEQIVEVWNLSDGCGGSG
ncbi:hypothetical protein AU467_35020 [Mesorhizobium loti]|uniref:Uncharacterized protein n=1 Tax=Rhizobium loti TaxID=381 RepID=A0A101KWF3_RHILI|nr:hypothetical protein AU467_35020 [Mesorhizobium loti]